MYNLHYFTTPIKENIFFLTKTTTTSSGNLVHFQGIYKNFTDKVVKIREWLEK